MHTSDDKVWNDGVNVTVVIKTEKLNVETTRVAQPHDFIPDRFRNGVMPYAHAIDERDFHPLPFENFPIREPPWQER